MKVAKFGGSSLADANQIRKVCDIILSDKDRKLIVVSARVNAVRKIQRLRTFLIALGEKYYKEGKADAELQAVIDRFDDIVKGLELSPDITQMVADDLKKKA